VETKWLQATERLVRGYAESLQRERKDADYCPAEALEPYTEKQADHASAGRISLVEDVRKLL